MAFNRPLSVRHLPPLNQVYTFKPVTWVLLFLASCLAGVGLAVIFFLLPIFFRYY